MTAPEPLFPRLEVEATDADAEAGRRGGRRGLIVRLVDSHGHVNAERFADDAEAVVETARRAGVERILVPGWNVASSERALELVERVPWLDAAVGVHPHDAAKVDDAGWSRIVGWAARPEVRAIGETGLDYDRVFSPIPDQLTNLRRNLALAADTGKPVILHCRSAADRRDAQDALLAEVSALPAGSVRPLIHSFSGPPDYAAAMLELGAVLSFSGLVFRRGEEASAEAARLAPIDRVLTETDAPFLTPPGGPRARNEPEWVRVTASWLAETPRRRPGRPRRRARRDLRPTVRAGRHVNGRLVAAVAALAISASTAAACASEPIEPCLGTEPVTVSLERDRLDVVSHEAESDLELVRFAFLPADEGGPAAITVVAEPVEPGPFLDARFGEPVTVQGSRFTKITIDGLVGGADSDGIRSDPADTHPIREIAQVKGDVPTWIVGTVDGVCLRLRADPDAGLVVLAVTPD